MSWKSQYRKQDRASRARKSLTALAFPEARTSHVVKDRIARKNEGVRHMVSNRAAGATAEKAYQDYLEHIGYVVERAMPKIVRVGARVFATSHDLFGAFDLLSLAENGVVFSQITTAKGELSRKRAKIEELPMPKSQDICFEIVHAEKVTNPERHGKCWRFEIEEWRQWPDSLFPGGQEDGVQPWGWTNRKARTTRTILWDDKKERVLEGVVAE